MSEGGQDEAHHVEPKGFKVYIPYGGKLAKALTCGNAACIGRKSGEAGVSGGVV